MWDTARVRIEEEGILTIEWNEGGYAELYPAGDNLWEERDGDLRAASMRTRSDEQLLLLQRMDGSVWANRRLSAIEHPVFHQAGFVIAFLVFVVTFFRLTLGPLLGCRQCDPEKRRARRVVRWLMWLTTVSVLPAISLVIWFTIVGKGYLFDKPIYPLIITLSNSSSGHSES